jgi:hypothetical protein
VASDIRRHWQKPYFGAVPYIEAMAQLNSMTDMYGADTAEYVVTYFLGNCASWRGPDARRIKAELRDMLKGVKSS